MSTGFDTPENTALHRAARGAGRRTRSMTSRSGGAHLDLDARRRGATSPDTVQITLPGDSRVPIERNQSGPRATMWVTVASVSTLFTSVGLAVAGPPPAASGSWADQPSCGLVDEQAVQVGREPARERVVALDDLEQRPSPRRTGTPRGR